MNVSPRARPVVFIIGIIAAAIAIALTETHTWHRVSQLRGSGQPVSPEDIASLHTLLAWSSLVLLALGGALVVLIHRGFIAPLRVRLAETKKVLERQEKLSSLGVLAAGVAHEIRNPLTSIKVRLFTQQGLLEKGSEAHEDNVFITEEILRLEKIVKDFLAFARPSHPEFKVIEAAQPLREMENLFRSTLAKHNITLVVEPGPDVSIRADVQQLKQVLINLVQNAAEAIGNDGSITLRTRIIKGRRGEEPQVILEVEDTGPGIPRDVEQRLFDPFFTTKDTGTGLGLSIAARIMQMHDGRLEYRTRPGDGTTFQLLFPGATGDTVPARAMTSGQPAVASH